MDISELTRDQKDELKQTMLEGKLEHEPSWMECCLADEIISDDELYEEYGDVCFTEEDFFCTAH